MATRTLPEPQKGPVFKPSIKNMQFRMEVPREREKYDEISTLAARGIVVMLHESAPIADHRGNLRIFVRYQILEPMTAADIEEQKASALGQLQQQLADPSFPQRMPDQRPLTLQGMTKEEREMVKDYVEPEDRVAKKSKAKPKTKARNGGGAG